MSKPIYLTYDGEVFRPDEPVDLPVNYRVRVDIDTRPEARTVPKQGEPYSSLKYLASLNLNLPRDSSQRIDEELYGGNLNHDE